jgi:hypothetical protein
MKVDRSIRPSIHLSSQLESTLAGLLSPLPTSPSVRLSGPVLLEKSKKGALRLVQSQLNSFIINIISKKSRRKNTKKRPKIAIFSPFSGAFQAFLSCFRHLAPSPYHRLASALPRPFSSLVPGLLAHSLPRLLPQGMEGMHTVWTRYGKGMRPSPNSFAIKYGGMPYRGVGGWPKNINRRHNPATGAQVRFGFAQRFTAMRLGRRPLTTTH